RRQFGGEFKRLFEAGGYRAVCSVPACDSGNERHIPRDKWVSFVERLFGFDITYNFEPATAGSGSTGGFPSL
ncbi:MAG: hypothetical protein KHF84_09680, partial [Thermoplasmata archaeon]|nr:hypothetical protein [Candidatus Sysuiplasma jiujiangense]